MTMEDVDNDALEVLKRRIEERGEAVVVADYRCRVYADPEDMEIVVRFIRRTARNIRAANALKVRVYSRIDRALEL